MPTSGNVAGNVNWLAKIVRALLAGWSRSGDEDDTGLDPAVLEKQAADLELLRKVEAEVEEIRAKRQDVSEMTSAEKAAALKESRK